MKKPWQIYFKGKIHLQILLICSYIYSVYYYLTGFVFDTRNLLSGEIAPYYSTNLLPILIYKPFMMLTGGSINISVLISIFFSSIIFFKALSSCVQVNPEQPLRLYLSDFILFFPLFIIYIILPSKEQVYAISLSLIYSLVLNRKRTSLVPGKYLQIALLSGICLCVRPASVLLVPFVTISLFTLRNPVLSRSSRECFRINTFRFTRNSLRALLLIALVLLFLALNLQNLLDSMKQIIFQSSYEIGSTSTQLLNSKALGSASEIQIFDMLGYVFQSILFGAPFFSDATISIQIHIIAFAYVIANIFVVIPNIKHVVQTAIHNKINIAIIISALLLIFMSWFLFSLGLAFNSGTGLRYYSVFFFTSWINYAIARRQENLF